MKLTPSHRDSLPGVESAVRLQRAQSRLEQFLRRAWLVFLCVLALVLGAFGVVFSFANYTWLSIGAVLVTLLLGGHTEWKRRARWAAFEQARRRDRARSEDLPR
jgi:uncharacterized membrane protein